MRSRIGEDDVVMEEDRRKEENSVESEIDQSMQCEEEEHYPQPEDSSKDEIQSRSPVKKVSPHIVKRSGRSTRGVKPLCFLEV